MLANAGLTNWQEYWKRSVGMQVFCVGCYLQNNRFVIKVNKIKITFLHLAASELFNAVNVVANAFVEASHVIPRLFAFTPAHGVERTGDIFIVTELVAVGVTLWMAALCLVNVIYVSMWSSTQSEAVQVVTSWTQRPDMKTEKRWTLFSSTKINNEKFIPLRYTAIFTTLENYLHDKLITLVANETENSAASNNSNIVIHQ